MNVRVLLLTPVMMLAVPILVSGCASSAAGIATNIVLTAMGVKNDPASTPPKNVSLQVYAADNLNADGNGRGISAVMRIYKLKDATAFNQAPIDSLTDADRAKQFLGADLIEVKEHLLLPGQRYQFQEKVDAKNGFLGIAIQFRNPHPQRWKLAMSNTEIKENTPIVIGAHACALNVTSGLPERNQLDSKFLVSIAPCKK
ncbi:MAG: type VI secretion system lipoprotein TssJ [Thiobacillus sp.]|nr:type VI secretion system lipoprotein TssJ [Thiobacillus sp.]